MIDLHIAKNRQYIYFREKEPPVDEDIWWKYLKLQLYKHGGNKITLLYSFIFTFTWQCMKSLVLL